MAEIIANEGGGKKSHGKRRAKKHSTHIDMTPMVDLMSLLITFFMLTTAFSKPKIMEILLPEKSDVIDTTGPKVIAERTLNIIMSADDKVYYFVGKPPVKEEELAEAGTRIKKSDYSKDGVRKIILKMNMLLYERVDSITQKVLKGESKISQDSLLAIIKGFKKSDKKGPIVMIKAAKNAKYKNIVDIIDEMAICNVARYAIVDINEFEQKLIETLPK